MSRQCSRKLSPIINNICHCVLFTNATMSTTESHGSLVTLLLCFGPIFFEGECIICTELTSRPPQRVDGLLALHWPERAGGVAARIR